MTTRTERLPSPSPCGGTRRLTSGYSAHKPTVALPLCCQLVASSIPARRTVRKAQGGVQKGGRHSPEVPAVWSPALHCKVPQIVGVPCTCKSEGKQHRRVSTGQRGDKDRAIYTCRKVGGGCGGRTIQIADLEKVLELGTTVLDHAACPVIHNGNTEICGDNPAQAGTCYGDSGGPLLTKNSRDEWILAGLVSG
ncbi:trypsin-like serine protease [Streptomyces cyaneofuscatus]|uniref:trypsin-like serine protease n=1 Tax=Streptomyces cyaneofuscatus TaxID=66883 RepID=UPI00380E0B91